MELWSDNPRSTMQFKHWHNQNSKTIPMIHETDIFIENVNLQCSLLDARLSELIMGCKQRQHASADASWKDLELSETECTLQFAQLLSFTDLPERQPTVKDHLHELSADDSAYTVRSHGAAWYVGESKAREYFTSLSLRQNLLGCLKILDRARCINCDDANSTTALCSYLIHDILVLGEMDSSSRINRKGLREAVETAYSELLDLLDLLTLLDSSNLMRFAEDYASNGRTWRARALLRSYLHASPDDIPALLMLGHLLFQQKRYKDAASEYAKVIELQPEHWSAHRQRGLCQMRALHLDDAIISLETARAMLDRTDESKACADASSNEIQRARRLRATLREAQEDEKMPSITLEAAEIEQGYFHPETLSVAEKLYRRHGTLCIQNAFDPNIIEACREQFMSDYSQYFTDEPHKDALQIGDRRFQVTIALHGHFNQPAFYANPFVIELMETLINTQVIIGSTVCATSLPGSRDQHLHKDHRALFTDGVDDEPVAIPPVAITTMIPLVDLDEQVGTTLVKKGSHRKSRKVSATMPYQTPVVAQGGCYLMDLALSHKGQGNRTTVVRPVVNMVYCQHWFTDNKNFKLQPPLRISPEEYARMPGNHRKLVDWAVQSGPQVNR